MKNIFLIFFILISALYATDTNQKTLKVAFGFDKPPFVFGKNTLKGIEPDLIQESLRLMNYKVQAVRMTKDKLSTILDKKNDIDVVSTITPHNKKLYYSDDFTYYKNYAITRKSEHLHLESMDDLKYLNFVTWNGAYNDLGEKFYNMFNPIDGTNKKAYHDNIVQSDDVKLFFSGKADSLIIDKTIFHWYKKLFKNNDKYTFHPIFPDEKIYPVTFRSKEIRDIFNEGFRRLKESGRYQEILNFYQTQNISEFIDYVNVVSAVASKYIYINDTDKLKTILKQFLNHPDIEAISIDSTTKNIFTLTKNRFKKDTPCFQQNIHYTEGSNITTVGTIKIYYSRGFKSANGILIPTLENFKNFSINDLNILRAIYKRYNLIKMDNLNLTKDEINYLKKHKTITVHNEMQLAPYNFNEDGIPKGFSIDYMDLLAKKLDIQIKYISNYSWNQYLTKIRLEKIDVISNIVNTPKRAKYINFTTPFMQSKKIIFSNNEKLKNLKALRYKTVALPKSFFIEGYIREHHPEIKIKTYKNILECIMAVINQEADALIGDNLVVNDIMRRNGLNIKYANEDKDTNLVSNISLGVRKSQKLLRDILQKAQDCVTKEELRQLKKKWFNKNDISTQIFSKDEIKYIKMKKVLKICLNPDWKPIEFISKDQPDGISIDLINMMTKKMNLEYKFIKTDSLKKSQQLLKEKICDILPTAIKTKQMGNYAHFTRSYLSYNLAIVTKKDKPLINNITSILGKKVALDEVSGVITLLKNKYPNIDILKTKNSIENLQKVKDGDAYFTMVALPVLTYYQKKYDFDTLQIAGYSNMKLNLSVAIRDDDKQLFSIIDKTLKSLPQENIDIINQKWTSQEVIKVIDYTMIWIIIAISLLIISIIVMAYQKLYTLKKEIDLLNKSLENRVQEEIVKNRKKEKIMLHQGRLAQMGEMISIIAHQWRQPLNSLALLNQALILKYKMGKVNQEFIDKFKDNSKLQISNMSQTIDDFRNFFRPEKEKIGFYINDVLKNMLKITNPILESENINLNLNIDQNAYVVGYPNELGQVILNIINNAKDALISSEIEDKTIDITLTMDEKYINLSIADNANGIPHEIIDKIFDPYFSTKEEKNGTGLGLYMSKIIIENHMDSKLSVTSSDKGSRFNIEFMRF
jgi:ABC-type amino acid transport substrate-binding protein